MKTKADFEKAMVDAISAYPAASLYYQVRDPRLLASLSANAAMLSMLSSEQDVAAMEPYTMARDMTVLAGAAVRGVLPFGTPTVAVISVENRSASAFVIDPGRVLRDTQGRLWSVTVGATVPAASTVNIQAQQAFTSAFGHVVTASRGFYSIAVPQPANGHIVSVAMADDKGEPFEYIVEFINVDDGDKVFHLETDEHRQLYIRFGASGVAGYQPAIGETYVVTLWETEGQINVPASTLFNFQYSGSAFESGAKMSLVSIVTPGAAPMDINTMREVISYPSTYDSNAVYLGNFDHLVRRNLSPFKFLSVWNEQREEDVRGPSVDNINRLFVAARKTGMESTALNEAIREIIRRADDGYRISFVPVVDVQVSLSVAIYAQSVHDFAAVKAQADLLLLANYGEDSAWAKRGEAEILYKDVYDLLVGSIQALKDRDSDMTITVGETSTAMLPEHFRYVSAESLSVTVVQFQKNRAAQ